jgi:hypothetical protein
MFFLQGLVIPVGGLAMPVLNWKLMKDWTKFEKVNV